MIFYGNPIDYDLEKDRIIKEVDYDLEKDRIIKEVDEPTFMTDRRKETLRVTLRVTGDGTYYLHTNNAREEEIIITSFFVIENWAADHGVKL